MRKWTFSFQNFLPAAPFQLVFISGRRSRGERLLTYLGLPVATAALVLVFKVLRTLPQFFYSLKVPPLGIYHLKIDRYCVVNCIWRIFVSFLVSHGRMHTLPYLKNIMCVRLPLQSATPPHWVISPMAVRAIHLFEKISPILFFFAAWRSYIFATPFAKNALPFPPLNNPRILLWFLFCRSFFILP